LIIEYVPGSKWQYSNFGFVLIQFVIENLVEKTFPLAVKELIFDPLEMETSTFDERFVGTHSEGLAQPHDADGLPHKQQLVPSALAHGGLLTTPREFAYFLIELMLSFNGQSNCILNQQMVKQMFTPALQLDPEQLGIPISQGWGVFLFQSGDNLFFLHPGGNFPGANCWPIGFPNLGRGAVIMTNGLQGEILAMEILSAIMNEYGLM
jgi:CubicO group peptidase (beta-lactamase class C family)